MKEGRHLSRVSVTRIARRSFQLVGIILFWIVLESQTKKFKAKTGTKMSFDSSILKKGHKQSAVEWDMENSWKFTIITA